MFNISNNGIITLTRGDTAKFPVFINAGNIWLPMRYNLRPFDKLYFSVMSHGQAFEDGVLRKILTAEDIKDRDKDIEITLNHMDTINLLPGNYTYEIKLVTYPLDASGNIVDPIVKTISPKKKFILLD